MRFLPASSTLTVRASDRATASTPSADATAAREDAFTDFTRLGLIGPQLSSVIGGFPAATQVQTSTPPSAMQQALGLGIGGIGLAGAVKGLL